jgi:hypothetical protein
MQCDILHWSISRPASRTARAQRAAVCAAKKPHTGRYWQIQWAAGAPPTAATKKKKKGNKNHNTREIERAQQRN